jgi:Protein of unknown function (DUF2877)
MPILSTATRARTASSDARAPAPLGAAASVLVHDLLAGRRRPASVVAAGPAACYLDVDARVLAVVTAGGVPLPCAAVLAGGALPAVAPGGDVAVGDGAVHVDGRRAVEVCRWFDPRVRIPDADPGAVGRLVGALRRYPHPDALLPAGAADRLAGDLAGRRPHRAVACLVGRGTGLTPAGDDLLAGALAALRALGSPDADGLGAAVRALAPGRTTSLSAALLGAADAGAVIPEAAAVLRALSRSAGARAVAEAVGPAGAAAVVSAGTEPVEPAVDRLVGIGHTSGWHLAAGLAVGAGHALEAGRTGRSGGTR